MLWKIDWITGLRKSDPIKNERLYRFKDAWIEFHRVSIINAAKSYGVDVELLAGVAWIEVGGDPAFLDDLAFGVRSSLDYLQDALPELPPSRTSGGSKDPKAPSQIALDTSFGAVSMQLATAMRTLGMKPESASSAQTQAVRRMLEDDLENIKLVAQHLDQLRRFDFGIKSQLGEFEIVVIASRYNRGTARPLSDFNDSFESEPGSKNREFTEYGRALWRRRGHLRKLLRLPPLAK